MKWSAFTLVSRSNELMEKAVRSVAAQNPDEYILYCDPKSITSNDLDKIKALAEEIGAEVRLMKCQFKDHYADCCLQVWEAIKNAKYPWVLDLDDDDEFIGSIDSYLRRASPLIGALYGNKIQVAPEGEVFTDTGTSHRWLKAWDIHEPFAKIMIGMRGSAIMYNRQAFRQVHKNLDIYRGYTTEDFGYWWEYKVAYWMLRAGFTLKAVGGVTMLQNVNTQREGIIVQLGGRWDDVVTDRNRLPFISNFEEMNS